MQIRSSDWIIHCLVLIEFDYSFGLSQEHIVAGWLVLSG